MNSTPRSHATLRWVRTNAKVPLLLGNELFEMTNRPLLQDAWGYL